MPQHLEAFSNDLFHWCFVAVAVAVVVAVVGDPAIVAVVAVVASVAVVSVAAAFAATFCCCWCRVTVLHKYTLHVTIIINMFSLLLHLYVWQLSIFSQFCI